MKLNTLLMTALMALPFVGVAGNVALAQQRDTAGSAAGSVAQVEAGESDAALVNRIAVVSDHAMIVKHFAPMLFSLQFDRNVPDALDEIAALDADMRALFWLLYLRSEMKYPEMHAFFTREALVRKQAARQRRSLIEKGISGAEADAFLAPILADASYRPKHADAVAEALLQAGLTRQHAAFVAAQALAARHPDADFSRLDADFGMQPDLRAATDDYMMRSPAIAAWKAELRERMSDDTRLSHLRDTMEFLTEAQVRSLPKPLRIIHCIDSFNREMFNGTLSNFFQHPTGDHAADTVAAMRALGLTRHADALQRGMDMLGTPYPSDRQARQTPPSGLAWSDLDRELGAMTADIDQSDITPALLSLAKRQGLLPK